jgi:hypothetical protein
LLTKVKYAKGRRETGQMETAHINTYTKEEGKKEKVKIFTLDGWMDG